MRRSAPFSLLTGAYDVDSSLGPNHWRGFGWGFLTYQSLINAEICFTRACGAREAFKTALKGGVRKNNPFVSLCACRYAHFRRLGRAFFLFLIDSGSGMRSAVFKKKS